MNNKAIRMNKNLSTSRRRFLDFAIRSGFSSSLMQGSAILSGLLANRFAHANTGEQTKVRRIVFVFTPMGAPKDRWLPIGEKMNQATQGFDGVKHDCHFHDTNVSGAGLGVMRVALGQPRWDAGWSGDTIDHQMATVLGVYSPYPSLQLGVQSQTQGEWQTASVKNNQYIPLLDGPAAAYQTLFGSQGTSNALQLKQHTFSIAQKAMQCDKSLLSQDERLVMERYEHSLAELSDKLDLTAETVKACSPKAIDLSENPGALTFIDQAKLQAEVLTQALECGLTNVGVLQLSNDTGEFIGSDSSFTGGMHVATCGSPTMDHYANLVNDLSGCIAYLIKLLSERDDPAVPGSKLIDNTLVLQVCSVGDGPNHGPSGAPCVISTRIPEFKTGLTTPQNSVKSNNLQILQTVAVGLGLEEYIGKENHHCIWPFAGEMSADFLANFLS